MTDEPLFHLSTGQQQLLGRPLGPGLDGPVLRHQAMARVPEGVTPEVLVDRWEAMTARHEILRTAFRVPGVLTGLLQTTDPAGPALRTVAVAAAEAAEDEWSREVDLAAGGLVRAAYAGGHLVLTAAAAAADPRSLELLMDELLTGEPVELDPLPFLDYATWEAEELAHDSDDSRVARAYWRGLVGEVSEAPVETRIGPRSVVTLDGAGALTAPEWLAAFAVVRGRHAPLDDPTALIAVAVDGRTDAELTHAIGPFERYVPVVVPPADSRADLATTVTRLGAEVDAAARFAMFAPPAAGSVAFSARGSDVRSAGGRFDLELVVTGRSAALWYDASRVSGAEAGWLADQVTGVAVVLRDEPTTPVAELDVVGDRERVFLEEALTGEGVTADHPTVPAALAAHAVRQPDAPAVVEGDRALTYGELDQLTRRLASALSDDSGPVGILMDHSADAVVAALGILRAGRAYVALEPTHPPARIAVQLDLAGIATVVTTDEHGDLLPGSVARLSPTDLPEPPDEPGAAEVTGDHLAYLIFTSGSTGTPKPVAVTHANLTSYVAGLTRRLDLGPNPRMASVTGLSTDLGNTSVFGALLTGGTAEIVPPDAVTSGARLAALVGAHGVTALKITPSHLRALLADPGVALDLPVLISGGEPLDGTLVEAVRAAGVSRVVNHYGPTETTVGVLTHEAGDPVETQVPLGRPLPHVRSRVVDAAGRIVPVGVVGELEISGPAVAAGYLGDTGPTGFGSDAEGRRRFRTGDLVRTSADGTLSFVGRADDQVKVRGFRVDLGEIEVALRAEPGVVDAASVVVDDTIRAFVVTSDAALDVAAVVARLGRRLPPPLVPASVRPVASLPRTPSGKVDRSALGRLGAGSTTDAHGAGRPPSTETEASLLTIWREVMPGAVAGVDDNFFQIGGHSLLATKVIARSRSVFAVDVPLHVIFASPTVAAMAADIDARRGLTDGDIDALLADVEGMSDAEVARLLHDAPPPRDDDR